MRRIAIAVDATVGSTARRADEPAAYERDTSWAAHKESGVWTGAAARRPAREADGLLAGARHAYLQPTGCPE